MLFIDLQADAEYVRLAPLYATMDEATDTSDWDVYAWEAHAETLAEIGSERALSGSRTPTDDAARIWRYEARCRALRRLARNAPQYANDVDDMITVLPI